MVRKKALRKNLGRKNNGQSYFCRFCNVSVKKYIVMNNLGNILMLRKKNSQYDKQLPNLFNLREVCVQATNS